MSANEVRTHRGANGVRSAPEKRGFLLRSASESKFSAEATATEFKTTDDVDAMPLNAQRHLDELQISCFFALIIPIPCASVNLLLRLLSLFLVMEIIINYVHVLFCVAGKRRHAR